MFPSFCNKCYADKSFQLTLELFLSQCGHVLCEKCSTVKCAVCQRPYKPIRISKHMPQSMSTYFDDPQKLYSRFQKVVKFQLDQEAIYADYHVNILPTDFKKVQCEMQALKKLEIRLRDDMEHEKERIKKLKEYIAYYERRLEQPTTNVNPSKLVGKKIASDGDDPPLPTTMYSQRYCPKTPTLSVNNSSHGDLSLGDNSNAGSNGKVSSTQSKRNRLNI